MKTIIKSLLVIVAVGAVAGTATYAYFSANAEIKGNTFSAGTLILSIGGTTPFNVGPLAPGQCEEEDITVNNTGTLTARDLEMTLEKKHWEGNNWRTDGFWHSWDQKDSKSLCDAMDIDVTDSAQVDIQNRSHWDNDALKLDGTIAPEGSTTLKINVCLLNDPRHEQNELQGKTCTFDLNVNAKAYEPGGHTM